MLTAGSGHRLGTGPGALRAKEGELMLQPDASSDFALRHGLKWVQTFRHSVQDVSANNLELARRYAKARSTTLARRRARAHLARVRK